MATEQRTEVSDLRVLAALAHPVRVQLLNYLLGTGAHTATQCAEVADASPSACSYHLRHMERFGLVARVPADESGTADGRERVWRAAATGFVLGGRPSADRPAVRAVRQALGSLDIDEAARLARRYVSRADTAEAEWQDAAVFATYGLAVTADELTELAASIDALVRPFIAATRDDHPSTAEAVHVTLQAFKRIDRA
jgi:DNA-binding transcriptional ArsR family regulator